MTTEPVAIKRRKLSDEVQDRLLTIIHSEKLSPGDSLPSERELMASFGVGRPAIREAMQNLQRMGLVEIRHGERPKVAKPSIDQMVGQVADYYEREVTYAVDGLSASIEPILLVVVGGMMMIVAAAVFLPMWDMMNAVRGGK